MIQRDYDPNYASTMWEYEPADPQPDWRALILPAALFAWGAIIAVAWWLFLC